MAVIGFLCLLAIPLLWGITVSKVVGKDNFRYLYMYLTGFLSLLLFFLLCLLFALKKDLNLNDLEKIFSAGALVLSLPGIVLFAVSFAKKKFYNPFGNLSGDEYSQIVLVCVAALGVFAFFLHEPSYLNDDTFEVVATTLSRGSIYEYSSLLGTRMEAGLPIFTKVYVMPMFYSVICDLFGISMPVLATFVSSLVFVLNLMLVRELAIMFVGHGKRTLFIAAYIVLMIVGTYLPSGGIPVTVGYAILREGYSGYAVCYGLVIPFALLLACKKQYFHALTVLATTVCLVRLDRIWFALTDLYRNYIAVNAAGHLFVLYLISVIALLVLRKKNGTELRLAYFLIPSVAVVIAAIKLTELIGEEKIRLAGYVAVLIVFLSACDFRPFSDAVWGTYKSGHAGVSACLELLPEDSMILSTNEFMERARRVDGTVGVAYGRDAVSVYLTGINYETTSENLDEYRHFAVNFAGSFSVYEQDTVSLLKEARSDGINTVVIPESRAVDEITNAFYKAGFERVGSAGGYMAYRAGGNS